MVNLMFLFNMHIMWYESKMINETLDSILTASDSIGNKIDFKFCLNSQTFIEQPVEGKASDMFDCFLNHDIFKKKNVEIIYKTNEDPFYNVGDLRRDVYDNKYKYTVWGESDTIIPPQYFILLDRLLIDEPHILSLSSRKMWDESWRPVEHMDIQDRDYYELPEYFRSGEYISQEKLNEINDMYEEFGLIKLPKIKVDGSMLALSANLPTPFISPNQHFFGEDTCAALFFEIKGIPQYHLVNLIKGHNSNHPLKRTNTTQTREDDLFLKYSEESKESMYEFLKNYI